MHNLGYTEQQGSVVCAIILVTMTIVFPISAYISDKIGRKPVIIFGSILYILVICPIFVALVSMNYVFAIFHC
jgi:MHS family proline/betaine transporter-like MFS transporter